ncbi:PLP-dependent cysteine synthase family protein [Paenibacillus lutrae]|uniref:Pyridoxal-phosphate dependent enzyme n=1 Tax=Paenibacillus lutrae TaxID=2078573 RepID=A0A7X3FEX4_9BACL|nr:cysteine synthase family protein [Paenibacillus lutrae]MVO98379.1 pyridoxal-phosphate dependent enzyme [Paenibacillus lutrae]
MNSVLDTIGKTPVVQLRNVVTREEGELWIKLERTNPGGSIKDRPALFIVEMAERRGWLKPGGTLIESSSGNFGISLAMIGAARGYRVIILVDPKTTSTNLSMLKAYGAEVIVVTEQDDSGSYHKTRITLANKLHREIPDSFRPDQCFNLLNSEAHYKQTADELFQQCGEELDAVILTVSTGGQIGGFSRYFKEKASHVKIIAVDAIGSTIFGGVAHPYLLPGMGLSWTPANAGDLNRIDAVYKVPDEESFRMCRMLARHEGILCGGSTGAAALVALKLVQARGDRKRIAVIASDNGERYLSTIYNDDWMNNHSMSTSTSPADLREWTRTRLQPYSVLPAETANYKPELADLLDSPSRYLKDQILYE